MIPSQRPDDVLKSLIVPLQQRVHTDRSRTDVSNVSPGSYTFGPRCATDRLYSPERRYIQQPDRTIPYCSSSLTLFPQQHVHAQKRDQDALLMHLETKEEKGHRRGKQRERDQGCSRRKTGRSGLKCYWSTKTVARPNENR